MAKLFYPQISLEDYQIFRKFMLPGEFPQTHEMMGLGIFFTLLVGGGLMALVFYSSRAGYDEPPEVVQEKKHRAAKWAKVIPRHKKRRSF